jgi:hypothetical protein
MPLSICVILLIVLLVHLYDLKGVVSVGEHIVFLIGVEECDKAHHCLGLVEENIQCEGVLFFGLHGTPV